MDMSAKPYCLSLKYRRAPCIHVILRPASFAGSPPGLSCLRKRMSFPGTNSFKASRNMPIRHDWPVSRMME